MLDRLVRQHAEGRDDVFLEVLVLVVAPDQHEVRAEVVEAPPCLPEALDQRRPVAPGRAEPFVGAVLLAHRRRPSVGLAVPLGKVGVLQDTLEDARHVFVPSTERGIVRHAEAQDRTHGSSSLPGWYTIPAEKESPS